MSAGTAWLRHALCTDPADRPAAEAAIITLYAQLNRPPPTFVWVASPPAAARLLPRARSLAVTLSRAGPPPVENALATLYSATRRGRPSAWDPLRRTVREAIAGIVRAEVADPLGLHWFGQHDVDWVAHVPEPSPWVTLARSCGWWWPRENLCVVSERPTVLRTEPIPGENGERRLHAPDGPAVQYPDGWAVHAWHGTRVPSWVIDEPTVDHIAEESNVEVRRCAIERIGWGAFIDQAGLRLVAQSADPGNPGNELRLYDLPYQLWGAPTRLLLAVNGSMERDGTRRRYGLRVPPWFDDPLDAAGWTYGLTGAQYARLERRT
jgi:hypothetical protein